MATNNTQSCSINSDECKEKVHKVGDRIAIPKTNVSLIVCEIFLCVFHYNKFIVNKNHRLEKLLQVCSYPKYKEYRSQSKNANKKQKNIILKKF